MVDHAEIVASSLNYGSGKLSGSQCDCWSCRLQVGLGAKRRGPTGGGGDSDAVPGFGHLGLGCG